MPTQASVSHRAEEALAENVAKHSDTFSQVA